MSTNIEPGRMLKLFFVVSISWIVFAHGTLEARADTPARWNAEDFDCPDGAEMRDAASPDGAYSALWCQFERGQQVARHGPYLELFADGKTARQGLYDRGVQAGRWIRWSPSGEIVSDREIYPGEAGRHILQPEDLCPPGTRRHRSRALSDKTYLESECQLADSREEVLHGPVVRWEEIIDARGLRYALRSVTDYQNGKRHGRFLLFAGASGEESLVLEESYDEAALEGESRAYFLDGTLRELSRFEKGRVRGVRIGFYADGRERWRVTYGEYGGFDATGDLTIDGEPCPERSLPYPSPDGLEIYCVRGAGRYRVREGPYAIRDTSGRVIERGLYESHKKVEIWEAPPGTDLPQQVSDQELVAEAQLMVGGRPYLTPLSLPEPETMDSVIVDSSDVDSSDIDSSDVDSGTVDSGEKPAASDETPSQTFDYWLQNTATRDYVSARAEVDQGRMSLFGLGPGTYYLQVRVDAVATNPELYPGDLMASSEFTVREGEVASFEIGLIYTLRLLAPWDNSEHIPGMERRCGDYGATPGPLVRFTWEPPPLEDLRGVEYSYYLWSKSCDPHGFKEKLLQGKTSATHLEVELPDSPRATYYNFQLVARREDRAIGQLMTFGSDGSYGWSLNFQVGDSSGN